MWTEADDALIQDSNCSLTHPDLTSSLLQISRSNSSPMKMNSQEQVNHLTRFLFLNEETRLVKDPTKSSSRSGSRRGSFGVHFNENVQIRLFRRKSESTLP